MDEYEINYRTLRQIQQTEKNSPILTDLKTDFYLDLVKYLEELTNRLKNESSYQKQTLLKDEIQNTQKITINIYELREKKILLAAISKARGGNPEIKNMTNIERNLFDTILSVLKKTRNEFLKKDSTEKKNNSETKKEPKKPENTDLTMKNKNPIVIVTENIPEFIGTNEKKYNLRKNDVLSLPEDMCDMLSRREIVKKIDS